MQDLYNKEKTGRTGDFAERQGKSGFFSWCGGMCVFQENFKISLISGILYLCETLTCILKLDTLVK